MSKKGEKLPPCEEYIDFAVIESLWFQIILHSCSFLDEWDNILGVNTEKHYSKKILKVKRVTAPASKAIKKWKDLKKFRNEVVAHSFRDKEGSVTIYTMSHYNCPQNEEELYYLVCFLNAMIMKLLDTFSDKINLFHEKFDLKIKHTRQKEPVNNPKVIELRKSLKNVQDNLNPETVSRN